MRIKNLITAGVLSVALALGVAAPQTAEGRVKHKHKRVYKHKRIHHRHAIGLRHIGKGTKTKTTIKSETHH